MGSKTLKHFKPSVQGRTINVAVTVDGEKEDIEVGPGGYRPTSKAIQDVLLSHKLYGHSFGFIALDTKDLKHQRTPVFTGDPTVEYNRAVKKKEPKVEIIEEDEPEISLSSVSSFNDAQTYLKEVHDLEHKDVASKDKVFAAAEELDVSFPNYKDESDEETAGGSVVKSEDTPDTDGDGEITAEDATKINHAKDYLKDEMGVDGREITTPEKIKAKAEELNVSFPNVDWGD